MIISKDLNSLKNQLIKLGLNEFLAIIICLDQFSRHVYRNKNKEKIDQNTLKAT